MDEVGRVGIVRLVEEDYTPPGRRQRRGPSQAVAGLLACEVFPFNGRG